MRLLHLAPRLSHRGGADQYLLTAIAVLAHRGPQRLVVGRRDGGIEPPCPTREVDGLGGSGLDGAPVDLDGLEREVDGFGPDVVHLHGLVHPDVLAAARRWPAVLTIQDHRLFCPGRGKWTASGEVCRQAMDASTCAGCFGDGEYFQRIFELTRRRLDAAADLPMCVLSAYMRSELVALGIPTGQVRIVPPAVRGFQVSAPGSGPGCVVFAGRLVEAKGVWDAVAAWKSSGLDLPLVIAGTGPLRGALEDADLDVTGWLSAAELAQLYRRAELVLMPSRWQEPFGIVGLEALSLGVPVAAWDSGGMAEWCPAPGLVPWGDVDGLARTARSLAGTRAALPAGFGSNVFVTRLEALFGQVVSP